MRPSIIHPPHRKNTQSFAQFMAAFTTATTHLWTACMRTCPSAAQCGQLRSLPEHAHSHGIIDFADISITHAQTLCRHEQTAKVSATHADACRAPPNKIIWCIVWLRLRLYRRAHPIYRRRWLLPDRGTDTERTRNQFKRACICNTNIYRHTHRGHANIQKTRTSSRVLVANLRQ